MLIPIDLIDCDHYAEGVPVDGFYERINRNPIAVASVAGRYVVVCGRRRLTTAKRLGFTKLPCVLVTSTNGVAGNPEFAAHSQP